MYKQLERIDDLEYVINKVKKINNSLKSADPSKKSLEEDIISVTEMISKCEAGDKENENTLIRLTNAAIEFIDRGEYSNEKVASWYRLIKCEIALIFFNFSSKIKEYEYNGENRKLDELLLDFFDRREMLGLIAHFTAARRFAFSDPMRCYNETLDDFNTSHDFFNNVYSNVEYHYDPEKINDVIYNHCPICGSDKANPYYCANQALIGDNSFSPAKLWMKCEKCGNLYAYNFPVCKMDEINGHYTRKSIGGIIEPRMNLGLYCDIFNKIKEYNNNHKYLEIGVGNGEMLAVALEMGYDVSAVEICREDCERISGALGVCIVWADFMEYKTDEKYDVVIMGDVLEHVSSPIEALKKAYSLLSEKGILWLSTPNFDSAFTRMYKFKDPMWNQKNHFTYFSFDGLKPFIEEIGFEVKRYDVSARYRGSMELILQKK